jgi:hypothetical protein
MPGPLNPTLSYMEKRRLMDFLPFGEGGYRCRYIKASRPIP